METKFNFNSAICTSKAQSERLLALGLKKETADMVYSYVREEHEDNYYWELDILEGSWDSYIWPSNHIFVPAWSLHRIWVLMPKSINTDKRRYYLQMNAKGDIGYFSDNYHALEYFYGNETIYDDCISCIEWLIKEGYFNKEYLV